MSATRKMTMASIQHCVGNFRRQEWWQRLEIEMHAWQKDLPENWDDLVVAPHYFEVQREYEVDATRVMGLDHTGATCYCSFDYYRTALRYDDGDVLCEEIVYSEAQCAWRLCDGTWLVRRALMTSEDCGVEKVTYRVADTMPR